MPPERSGDGPQNIYDDPRFFAGYATLERFGAGWERAMELPDFLGLLPGLSGRRVLDLGCGAGQLTLHLARSGASEVLGIDVSERMLGLARTERAHPRVTYLRQSMEETDFPPARFDLVVSSLAFHYVRDYRGLVGRIGRWLAPGGVLVFSTEHPIYTARASDRGSSGGGKAAAGRSKRAGWWARTGSAWPGPSTATPRRAPGNGAGSCPAWCATTAPWPRSSTGCSMPD